MQGRTGDVMLLPSNGVSYSSQSLLHDDGPHDIMVASNMKFMIGDGARPVHTQYFSELRGVDADSLMVSFIVNLQHSEPHSLSLVHMLYWDDFHKLFSILKVFHPFPRRFMMSLPSPTSYPTVRQE